MNVYRIKLLKISGMLKESYAPKTNIVIKSKAEKSNIELFKEAAEYIKKNYGLKVEAVGVFRREKTIATQNHGDYMAITTEDLLTAIKQSKNKYDKIRLYAELPESYYEEYEMKNKKPAEIIINNSPIRALVYISLPTDEDDPKASAMYDKISKEWHIRNRKSHGRYIRIVE